MPKNAEINECLSHPCDGNATCTNTPGSYICECSNGFSGNGLICISGFSECFLNVLKSTPFQILMSAISLEFVMEMLLVMTFKGAMGAPAIVAIQEMALYA